MDYGMDINIRTATVLSVRLIRRLSIVEMGKRGITMTQEEKELLLKDLCGRLPYGVKIQVYYEEIAGSGYFDEDVWAIDNDEPFHVNDRWLENIKPYLRPMSSMTEEECYEWNVMVDNCRDEFDSCFVDYCNRKHLDYRSLIPMGLALEAPEEMYKKGE